MGDSELDARRVLADSLKGQVINIPDLHAFFQDWPDGIHKEVKSLRSDVNERLDNLFRPSEYLTKLKAAEAAIFGASWWPYANYDALRVATYLSIWLFAWDDETDSLEFSMLGSDFDRSQVFRAMTTEYVRWCLGFGGTAAAYDSSTFSPVITNFKFVGDAMMERYSFEQRCSIMKEIEFFIEMAELEQRVQLSGKLPAVQEYRRRRMGTSAVGVCLAITEYAYDMDLPPTLTQDVDMKALRDATNVIISTINDILSVHKEVAQGQVDSLIPLLYHHASSSNVQSAVDTAVTYLQTAIFDLNAAAEKLLRRTKDDDAEVYTRVGKFIDGCRYACTANLNWSLGSQRYDLGVQTLVGGMEMTI